MVCPFLCVVMMLSGVCSAIGGSFPFWLLRFSPPHLPDFLLRRLCKLCHFILKLADIIEIYADVLDCVSRPFLVALMLANSNSAFRSYKGIRRTPTKLVGAPGRLWITEWHPSEPYRP